MTDQPSHLPSELRTLVKRYGTRVLDDADGLRATLDDFLDEGTASPGDVNLLIDAVRFGSLPRLETLLGEGAEPSAATADVAAALAQRRGGDAESAYWACAVLGYAAELLPGDLIPGTWVRSSSQLPSSATATGATSASVADHGPDFDHHTFGRTGAASFDDPDVTHRPAGGSGGDPDQPPPTGSLGPRDNSSTGDTTRGRPTWAIAAIATVIVLLVAAVIYLAVTRKTSGSDTAGGSEIVPMSDVTPHDKFGHFGDAIENGTALGTCYNSPTPGVDQVAYNCSFADKKYADYYLQLSNVNPQQVNNKNVLPPFIEDPAPNTIVTTEQTADSYHAYYMAWVSNGRDGKKNTPDDVVALTLYDVDPMHPGKIVFEAPHADHPLTHVIANQLLGAIRVSDVFPKPTAFATVTSLKGFAATFLTEEQLKGCKVAFRSFPKELTHAICKVGATQVGFGYENNLNRVTHRYGHTRYSWTDGNRSGLLYVSRYKGLTRLYWYDYENAGAYGTLLASSKHKAFKVFTSFADSPHLQ
jgi:hypothetical protein